MKKPSARERRGEKTRRDILKAARQIILEAGPAGLSMRTLANRIDYSPSGLYEYFDSKEQILQAVCEEAHGRLTRQMNKVEVSLPPDSYLIQIGQVYVDFAAANPELFQLMFSSVPLESPDAFMLSERSSYRVLLGAIQRGIDSGTFKTTEGFGLTEMAFAAWSMVHGISMLRIFMKDTSPAFEALKQQALLAIGRGLRGG